MRKLRIMQITHDLAIGGLQQVVVNICRSIDRDRFDISVLCLKELGAFASEVEGMRIRVYSLPTDNRRPDYLAFMKIYNILRTQKIDVIHTHNTQPLLDGTPAALMAGVGTIVHTDHARDFPDKKRYMFAEWLASKFAFKIVGVSEHTSQNLIKYEKIPAKKVITILNGVDGTKYDINIDREKKKYELGIANRSPIIGLGVRLTEQKGITYLLQAMPKVTQQFPNASLVIAGDGPLMEILKKEAAELKLRDNVFFVGPRLDIPELLKLFDLYVLPSLWEGLPMVIIEAMAAGCPILATDVGGNHMAIEHGKNGSLVSPKSPQKLAREIITLLRNPKLLLTYSENGQEIFQKEFSAGIMTQQYERLYMREMEAT